MKNYIFFSWHSQLSSLIDVIFGTWPKTLVRKFREYTMWGTIMFIARMTNERILRKNFFYLSMLDLLNLQQFLKTKNTNEINLYF